jgi:hypothetical protein
MLIDAWSEGTKSIDDDGRIPFLVAMEDDAPTEMVILLGTPLFAMPQFVAQLARTEVMPWDLATGSENDGWCTLEEALKRFKTYSDVDTHSDAVAQMTTSVDNMIRNACQQDLLTLVTESNGSRQLLSHMQEKYNSNHPCTDSSALSERLAPVNHVLGVCMQAELTFATPALHKHDFRPYQQKYLVPAFEMIHSGLEELKKSVSKDPEKYRGIKTKLSTDDRRTYDVARSTLFMPWGLIGRCLGMPCLLTSICVI